MIRRHRGPRRHHLRSSRCHRFPALRQKGLGSETSPTGAKDWADAPFQAQGSETYFRLALVASKFRVGENRRPTDAGNLHGGRALDGEDVTDSVDKQWRRRRLRAIKENTERMPRVSKCCWPKSTAAPPPGSLQSRKWRRTPFPLWPHYSAGRKFTRKEARAIRTSDSFEEVPLKAKGRPYGLYRKGGIDRSGGGNDRSKTPITTRPLSGLISPSARRAHGGNQPFANPHR